MITRLSTIGTPGKNYGSFAGKAESVSVDIVGIVTLDSETPKHKLATATAKVTLETATPKHTVG